MPRWSAASHSCCQISGKYFMHTACSVTVTLTLYTVQVVTFATAIVTCLH